MSADTKVSARRVSLARFAGPAGFVAFVGAMVVACIPEPLVTTTECPPFEDFKKVSPLLERRCGTLDCHGNISRPLRIYGQYGLRKPTEGVDDPGLYSGNLDDPTTQTEVVANYRAACGLEPEKMEQVQTGELGPEGLTLVRKPRLAEKHKGGRIWDQGKPPDRCLVGWVEGDYDPGTMDGADCATAIQE
ncbi:MAG TPA: hypothetical protein VL400_08750 [Polyangiaceae bacterium]|nr:hypothetical protein [Polyangiaceae bacterium]